MARRAQNSPDARRAGSQTTHLRPWRRVHRVGTVAELTPLISVLWEASAYREDAPDAKMTLQRPLMDLTDAQHAADTLAGEIVPHSCDKQCGAWMPVERRGEAIGRCSSMRNAASCIAA
jgi:hypothetical protein